MPSLFFTWLIIGCIGFLVWLFALAATATINQENKLIRWWTLFTVFWPIGVLILFIHLVKLTYFAIHEILE